MPPGAQLTAHDLPERRIVPAQFDEQHRAACPACQLGPDYLAELEASYINWATPPKLAARYGISTDTIERHASWYSLGLFRSAYPAGSLSAYAVAGLDEDSHISPSIGAGSAADLAQLVGKGAQLTDTEQVAGQSWEAEVKLRARGTGPPPSLGQATPVEAVAVEPDEQPEPVGRGGEDVMLP